MKAFAGGGFYVLGYHFWSNYNSISNFGVEKEEAYFPVGSFRVDFRIYAGENHYGTHAVY